MKRILFIAFVTMLSSSPAYAEGEHHGEGHEGGHYGGGWGWGGGWIFPALIGGAIAYDLSSSYYTHPAPVYVPGVAPSTVQYWYFCPAANAYYPYVPTCPSGWQLVPATPPLR